MKDIYIIGGSPCSGKSTIAEMLTSKYDMNYFKVDDYLDSFISKASEDNKKVCKQISAYTPEQTWMRDPAVQNEEELDIYNEIFGYIMEELDKLGTDKPVITEGAAFLPDLIKQADIDKSHYICITPTRDFQISHYKERPWIHFVLEGCSDKQKAFDNWMERDVLFAEEVRRRCELLGYTSIVTDGKTDIDSVFAKVSSLFSLE